MRTSVAMTTYSGAAYVGEQLTSIVGQSSPPAEIVVCDDRSPDETVRVITDFAKDSTVPIRVVVNDERLGWRANSLKAASLCESEVIVFCDQDDVWHPRKLELLRDAFADPATLVVFHDATIVDADLEPIGPFLQGGGERAQALAMERDPWRDVYGFTMAFRRDLLELWRYWPWSVDKSVGHERAAHDQWLFFLGSALGTTRHLPERLALYRQHGRNAVSAKDALRTLASAATMPADHRYLVELQRRVVASRVRILDAIAREHGAFGAAAAAASSTYSRYDELLAARATIHTAEHLGARLRRFASLVRRRAYSGGAWALPPATRVPDGIAVVLGPATFDRLRRARLRASTARASKAVAGGG